MPEIVPDHALIASVLELESLRIIGKPDGAGSGAWIRRVEDPEGGKHYLKYAPVSDLHQNEAVALAAWEECGLVPAHRILNIDPLVMLVTDLGGQHLRLMNTEVVESRLGEISALAKDLHSVEPPEGLYTTADLIRFRSLHDAKAREEWGDEGAKIMRRVEAALTTSQTEEYFVHGDFHHRNILVTEDGLRVIDPFGLVGDRACDLAFLAARRDDPEKAFQELIRHYGTPLPRVHEWFVWSLLLAHSHLKDRDTYTGASLQVGLQLGRVYL